MAVAVPDVLGRQVHRAPQTHGGRQMSNTEGAGVKISEHFDATQDELWAAIINPEELSAWFGGRCVIEPRVGGEVVFDAPGDGIVGTGVVRAISPPRPDKAVALIEHTFVDTGAPELVSTCVWSVVRAHSGCDLHLTMDSPSRLSELFKPGP